MPTAPTETIKLDAQYHADGCPAQRVEQHESVRPGKAEEAIPPQKMLVTRCCDCGGQHEEPIKEN